MTEHKKKYYIRWRGIIEGPLTKEEIISSFEKGIISKHYQISTDQLKWYSLSSQKYFSIKPDPVSKTDRNENIQQKKVHVNREDAEPIQRKPSHVQVADDPIFIEPTDIFSQSKYPFFPVINLFRKDLLNSRPVRWLLLFAVIPYIIIFLQEYVGWSFDRTIWMLEGYFCLFWAVYFYSVIQPRSTVWKRGILYALFTAFIGIPVLFIWHHIPIFSKLYGSLDGGKSISVFLGYVLGVGLLEETCKAMPLLLFYSRKRPISSVRMGTFLGVMSGLGFALSEGVDYSRRFWASNASFSLSSFNDYLKHMSISPDNTSLESIAKTLGPGLFQMYGSTLSLQILRFLILPLLHAAWAGVLGYFITLSILRRQWAIMFLGLFLVAVMHGAYDFLGGIWSVVMAFASILMLMSCINADVGIEEERQ